MYTFISISIFLSILIISVYYVYICNHYLSIILGRVGHNRSVQKMMFSEMALRRYELQLSSFHPENETQRKVALECFVLIRRYGIFVIMIGSENGPFCFRVI